MLCLGVLLLTVGISLIFPKIGRRFALIFYIFLLVTVWYLSCFMLNYLHKARFFDSDWLLSIFMGIYCASFGLLINVLVTGRKQLNYVVGILISWVCYITLEMLNYFIFKLHSRHLWKFFLMLIAQAFLSAYLNCDAEFMITKRSDYYRSSDWYLGMLHLNTDLFYRFFVDWFITKDVEEGVVDV